MDRIQFNGETKYRALSFSCLSHPSGTKSHLVNHFKPHNPQSAKYYGIIWSILFYIHNYTLMYDLSQTMERLRLKSNSIGNDRLSFHTFNLIASHFMLCSIQSKFLYWIECQLGISTARWKQRRMNIMRINKINRRKVDVKTC